MWGTKSMQMKLSSSMGNTYTPILKEQNPSPKSLHKCITRMAEIRYSKRVAHFSDSVMAAYISVTSEVASQTVGYTGRYFSWQLRIIRTITAQVFMYLGQYP